MDNKGFDGEELKVKEGFLEKRGHLRKNWKRRWFVLREKSLSYYDGKDLKNLKGSVSIYKKDEFSIDVHGFESSGVIGGSTRISKCENHYLRVNCFRIRTREKIKGVGWGSQKELLMNASSERERYQWIQSIKELISGKIPEIGESKHPQESIIEQDLLEMEEGRFVGDCSKTEIIQDVSKEGGSKSSEEKRKEMTEKRKSSLNIFTKVISRSPSVALFQTKTLRKKPTEISIEGRNSTNFEFETFSGFVKHYLDSYNMETQVLQQTPN